MYCLRKYKSFLCGTVLASVAWIICIYLYLQLNYEREKLLERRKSAVQNIRIALRNDTGERF